MTYPQTNEPYASWQPNLPQQAPLKKRSRWPWLVISVGVVSGIAVLVVVVLTGNRGDSGSSVQENLGLESVRQACGLSSSHAVIGDAGRTLTLDGEGKENASGLSWTDIECALDHTKMPESVRGRLTMTRALDGMQSASWDGYTATWNYHPDSGVNLIITSVR
ncbi:MAG TPA: hypothetical protein VGR06_11620 [Actinophytocola sp.]|jgi:hypothetical protein|uniref:hypothetical protein n=1 Tax=Actinophytocola sp. TaxID=1872138 RepID=UPI002E010BA7|nr:hypothetical protein [Actinophytocola sp.]